MTLLDFFHMLADHLIAIMFTFLVLALVMRFLAYKSGQRSQAYYNQFSRTVESIFEEESTQVGDVEDIDGWLKNLLDRIFEQLPERTVRFSFRERREKSRGKNPIVRSESLKNFASGKRSIVLSIRQQVDAFRSQIPPNFSELTRRVLDQDVEWRNLLGFIPIDSLSRIFNILPGLFIIGGIFGTFLGITSALPRIANIDLNNIKSAGPILGAFVVDVSFSMRTSITGILCSVIMTVLSALFPLDSVRKEIKRNLERSFEQMWFQLHGGNISIGERMIVKELKNIYSAFLDVKKPKVNE